jgi:hypothetical protein
MQSIDSENLTSLNDESNHKTTTNDVDLNALTFPTMDPLHPRS